MKWETVIGLEVHAQLLTQSKIFSGSSTAYGSEPNTQACAIDVGFPGVLPTMNKEAVLLAASFGLAVGAEINATSIFARKNYFYPDLPKGYQISQYEIPIVSGGSIEITTRNAKKNIRLTRAHLEEDAGKSLHEEFNNLTAIDLNRAGTPLLEIVSEPDMRSPEEAISYLKKLHTLVKTLKICDGNMQEGSFRCDANISVRPTGSANFGVRTEIKNINSFKYVEKALNHEIKRQISILENGGNVIQETRLYNPAQDITKPMRSKEEAHDYRYFPDPDLPPLILRSEEIEKLKKNLPELPDTKFDRFINEYGLEESDADQITSNIDIANFFEKAVYFADGESRLTANWLTGELMFWLNRTEVEIIDSPINPEQLGKLVLRIKDKTISGKIAKKVFEKLWARGDDVDQIIEDDNLTQITDDEVIEKAVKKIISIYPDQAQQVRMGEEKIIGFLVGQVMKETSGKANPPSVNECLRKYLAE